MNGFDAIIVPGGGVREGGELPPWAAARFDLALRRRTNEPILCLSQATPHRPPPLDVYGYPIDESAAGARYLIARGVPPEEILLESLSLDTIGNACFARLLHADPAGWRRLLVVTSAFHMPRTREIFRYVFGLGPGGCDVEFDQSPDEGLSPGDLQIRKSKERQGLEGFRRLVKERDFSNIAAFQRWIFTEHDAYSAAGRARLRAPLPAAELAGY